MNNTSVFLLPAASPQSENNSRRRQQQLKGFYFQAVAYITSRKHPLPTGNESHIGHKLVLGIYLNKLHRLVTFVSLHQAYSLRI